ncbi:N-acetyl-gamma-glutamyl-phosphate reductase [Candidatus Woesearchaeota archaeon]|nr:N-acetyl-gamma-glutamyl-phosphate reductase [Candidatus Woesearchaeota archaeon]
MKNVGIIGASGYTGYELVKILSKHKKVKLVVLNSVSYAGKKVCSLYPQFNNKKLKFTNYSINEINSMDLDLLFFCLPHKESMKYIKNIDSKIKKIDLSGDYRFSKAKEYEKVYGVKHIDKEGLKKAVYGLPEINKKSIKKANLIANPGCYVTASLLASLPIQKYAKYIVFDCKSGWSGAGKKSAFAKNPKIIEDNLVAYKLTKHRHKYEIMQFVGKKISFTPHVMDAYQGMMCTAHIILKKKINKQKIIKLYSQYYKNQPFVKIKKDIPQVKDTQKTNQCHIGGFEIDENNQLVVVSTIDNLLKGASGQAVQNMNLMLGFKESEGLK